MKYNVNFFSTLILDIINDSVVGRQRAALAYIGVYLSGFEAFYKVTPFNYPKRLSTLEQNIEQTNTDRYMRLHKCYEYVKENIMKVADNAEVSQDTWGSRIDRRIAKAVKQSEMLQLCNLYNLFFMDWQTLLNLLKAEELSSYLYHSVETILLYLMYYAIILFEFTRQGGIQNFREEEIRLILEGGLQATEAGLPIENTTIYKLGEILTKF